MRAHRVVIGLLAGLVLGSAIGALDGAIALRVAGVLEPIGTLWVNAIRMTVVPLVVSLLFVSVATHESAAGMGRLTATTIATFVALLVFVQISSTPNFCGSCHIMAPYYESWKHSSHKNIACVDCHIPPGVTAELRKKYEALSMVVKYFTGTYSTNPWTEVRSYTTNDATTISYTLPQGKDRTFVRLMVTKVP